MHFFVCFYASGIFFTTAIITNVRRVEISRGKRMAEKKNKTADENPLRTACQQYKTHVETVIGEKLTEKLSPKGNGLSGINVEDPFVQQRLKVIRDQARVLAEDVAFIIKNVIKEPSAQFYEKNTPLCVAIQKYKAAIKLLKSVGDIQEFKRVYLVHFRDLTKDKDSFDQQFINAIAKKLGQYTPNQAFFNRAEADFKNDAVVVVPNRRNSRGG